MRININYSTWCEIFHRVKTPHVRNQIKAWPLASERRNSISVEPNIARNMACRFLSLPCSVAAPRRCKFNCFLLHISQLKSNCSMPPPCKYTDLIWGSVSRVLASRTWCFEDPRIYLLIRVIGEIKFMRKKYEKLIEHRDVMTWTCFHDGLVTAWVNIGSFSVDLVRHDDVKHQAITSTNADLS